MPLIKGICIPPICCTIKFDLSQAFVEEVSATGTKKVDNPLVDLDAIKAPFKNPVEFGCDGCSCHKPNYNPPWEPMNPIPVPNLGFTKGGKTTSYQVAGGRQQVKWGYCLAAGTKFRFMDGKTWGPWQEAEGG